MATIEDGGPAFPTTVPGVHPAAIEPGMSLRDYFAAQALAGYLSNPNKPRARRAADMANLKPSWHSRTVEAQRAARAMGPDDMPDGARTWLLARADEAEYESLFGPNRKLIKALRAQANDREFCEAIARFWQAQAAMKAIEEKINAAVGYDPKAR